MKKGRIFCSKWLSTKQRDKPKVNKKKFFCLEGKKNDALIKRCNIFLFFFFFQSGFKRDHEPVKKKEFGKTTMYRAYCAYH